MPTNRWEELYRSSDVKELPWYTPVLDSDFDHGLKDHVPTGAQVLDLGTGPATQAIALAKRGYDVVATDIAASAIAKAKHAAAREHVRVDFRVDNILESRLPDGLVDAIVDRGVFHTFPPESRDRYVDAVHRILRPRGFLFLKTASSKGTWWEGPYPFAASELRGYFERSFDVVSIGDATFQGPNGRIPAALIAVLQRR